MPLETATYITSLVVTNPDGSDQKNTADDHIRLLKACLRRSWPQIDSAVSLSGTQLMMLNDVSASVQLQINTLRDGSATVYNALYANSASFAVNANNALSLGGVAAASFARRDVANTFAAAQVFNVSSETIRIAGGNNDFISFYNSAQSTRYGYIQMVVGGALLISNEQAGKHINLLNNGGALLFNSNIVWHAANDGIGSGLDADLLDGREGSESAIGSTAVLRTAAGYINATYFNMSASPINENPNVQSIVVTNGDGYLRNATPAYLGSQMQARNITGKAGTQKTLSSSTPSGGNDGDIWYRV